MTRSANRTQADVEAAAESLVVTLTRYFGLDVSTDAALARYREHGHPDLESALTAFETAVGDIASRDELVALREVVEHAAAELNGAWRGMWSNFQIAQSDGLSKIQGRLDDCCTIWTGAAELANTNELIAMLEAERAQKSDAMERAIEALDADSATVLKAELAAIPDQIRQAEVRRAQLLLERATAYLERPVAQAESNDAAVENALARWRKAEAALVIAEDESNVGRYRALAYRKTLDEAHARVSEAAAEVATVEASSEAAERDKVRRLVMQGSR